MWCRANPRLRLAGTSLLPSRLQNQIQVGFRALTETRVARASHVVFHSWSERNLGLPPDFPLDSAVPGEASKMYVRTSAHRSTVDPPPPEKKNQPPANAALGLETPTWLAIASGYEPHRQTQSPFIDMTKVAEVGGLQYVLAQVDSKAEILHLVGAVPSNGQWEALGRHFTSVRFLNIGAGWDEDWNDGKFPLHWPLELLFISDSGGERITTPAIMDGRITHLILFYACEMRSEGPVTKELMRDAEQLHFIPHKRMAPDSEAETAKSEGERPTGVHVFSVPHELHRWVYDKYAGRKIVLSTDGKSDPPSAMKSLQILGNDALQMLTFMALAKFHLVGSLESLTLDSQSKTDLLHVPPGLFLAVLPGLLGLQHLKLTLGSHVYAALLNAAEGQPFLHTAVPANIETLHFRGPVSMAAHLDEFAAAVGSDDFLPKLKRISFVLDQSDNVRASNSPTEPSLEQLRTAHIACKKVWDAAAERGIAVEELWEPWVEEHAGLFKAVDNRWAVLDAISHR